jgi:SAM-dependent methyltransferase
MKILDPRVHEALQSRTPLKLNLGAGTNERDGFYGVDLLPLPGVAVQADLNEPLVEFPDNSVGEILTFHCLEHIQNFLPLMGELHRVLRPSGVLKITVPHFSNPYGYSDPTHVRFFGLYTMFYFANPEDQPVRKVPSFYTKARFRVDDIWIQLVPRSLFWRCLFPFMNRVINRNIPWQDRYERHLCHLVPAWSITYRMSAVK